LSDAAPVVSSKRFRSRHRVRRYQSCDPFVCADILVAAGRQAIGGDLNRFANELEARIAFSSRTGLCFARKRYRSGWQDILLHLAAVEFDSQTK
jgi:hypothetical protein